MNQTQWTEVDRYLTSLFVPPDPALDAALAASVAANLPNINVSPTQGKLLQLLAQLQNAKTILEIGTLAAYSTIFLARGLSKGGHLTTLEFDPKHAEIAQQNLTRANLADVVEIIQDPALETLPKLTGPFDLIFIDADKQNLPDYFRWSLKLSRPGSLIIIDNVIRDGAVIDPNSKDPSVQGVRKMNDLIATSPHLTATALQTVGSKGYDGLAIVRVNGS